jgi:hypothetical protein
VGGPLAWPTEETWVFHNSRHPRAGLDAHVALALPFTDSGNRLPTESAQDALRAFEDSLKSALDGYGELQADETHPGTRTLHYNVEIRHLDAGG